MTRTKKTKKESEYSEPIGGWPDMSGNTLEAWGKIIMKREPPKEKTCARCGDPMADGDLDPYCSSCWQEIKELPDE